MRAWRAVPAIVAALLGCAVLASTPLSDEAEAAKPRQTLQLKPRVIATVRNPVYTAIPPGDAGRRTVFVVERGGDVRIIRKGELLKQRFLSVRGMVGDFNEQGLLSIAFHPRYERNGRVYAYFADVDDNVRVVSFVRAANRPLQVDPESMEDIITIPHPTYPAHNGGTVAFGPDGNMWLAPGDGGGPCDPDENAQNTESLLGKLLRISPLPNGGYTVPADNPFVGRDGRDEIYAYGLRNPFRFSFDVRTDTITIGDVGQRRTEEIDRERLSAARGANFGWDALEGSDPLIHAGSCFPERHPHNAARGQRTADPRVRARRRQLLGHRRPDRPRPEAPSPARTPPLRGSLRQRDPQRRPGPRWRHRGSLDPSRGRLPDVDRQRSRRVRLRDLAVRAGLPAQAGRAAAPPGRLLARGLPALSRSRRRSAGIPAC